VILVKINERNAALAGGGDAVAQEPEESAALPPKVVEVYTSVGKFLSTYKSGKLPKAFKIVPRLANWEEVLYTTDPDGWTPAATCEATRLFASNLNPKMAQRYFNLVLLPAVQRLVAAAPAADGRTALPRSPAPPMHPRMHASCPCRTLPCMHLALPACIPREVALGGQSSALTLRGGSARHATTRGAGGECGGLRPSPLLPALAASPESEAFHSTSAESPCRGRPPCMTVRQIKLYVSWV